MPGMGPTDDRGQDLPANSMHASEPASAQPGTPGAPAGRPPLEEPVVVGIALTLHDFEHLCEAAGPWSKPMRARVRQGPPHSDVVRTVERPDGEPAAGAATLQAALEAALEADVASEHTVPAEEDTDGDGVRFEPHDLLGAAEGEDWMFAYWVGTDYLSMLLARAFVAARGYGYEVLWDNGEEDEDDEDEEFADEFDSSMGWVLLTDLGDDDLHALRRESDARENEIAMLESLLNGGEHNPQT